MKQIPYTALLENFHRMLRERWQYVWGAAETGRVDCAGAFVWAYRRAGIPLYHGSNRMARSEAAALLPPDRAKPGMLAFKRRTPSEKGYALPKDYLPGGSRCSGDLNDYYHVGLVDSDPRYVLNAQSTKTGFVRSPLSQGWDAVACGIHIDMEGEILMEELRLATVVAPSGSTVNLRAKPRSDASLIRRIPVGATVTVSGTSGEWSAVTHGNSSGYMLTCFVRTQSDNAPSIAALEARVASLEAWRAQAEARHN